MSRLYGRSFDAFQTSNYLIDSNIPKYKEENTKTPLNDLIESTSVLDFYLPESAIEYLVQYPIHIVKSPFIPRNLSFLPNDKEPYATIFFKSINFKEEYKRELNFFLGVVLSLMHPDKLPKEFDFPCEYGDLFPLLLEYVYLKENNKEEIFSLKHLNELASNGENYIKNYGIYQKHLVSKKQNDFYLLNDKDLEKIDNYNKEIENKFLLSTLNTVVPLSSMDGVLQLIDKVKDKNELKELINLLYENPNNNRQELLKDYGVESFGYKRLRKEIDRVRGVKNE